MTEDKKWERARTGNIKTTSLHNARIALGVLNISAGYPPLTADPHVLYKTGRFAQISYDVIRYIRGKIFDECNYSPTYRALEDILIVMAKERKECST